MQALGMNERPKKRCLFFLIGPDPRPRLSAAPPVRCLPKFTFYELADAGPRAVFDGGVGMRDDLFPLFKAGENLRP